MSLSETEMIYLMAYVDNQVDDDELPEVLALLEKSEEAREIVRHHAAMGDFVREKADAHAAAGGADRIAARVMAEIDQLGGGKVIELERERARVALNRQRVKEFGALAAVAAIAAAFLLMPSQPDAPVATTDHAHKAPAPSASAEPAPTDSAIASAAPSASAGAAVAETESNEGSDVEVQSVESPDHPFSIFYVPADKGLDPHSSSVVVWIDE